MDSFEFNKFAGAVLGSVLFILAVSILTDALYETEEANPQAYAVAAVEEGGEAGGGAAEAAKEVPLATLLAQSDVERGAKAAKKCAACHNFEEGAGAKIGPDLYHVVGREVASAAGFSYSQAMKDHGGTWTFEELNHFITDPRGYISGTAMSFAGIKKPQERADVIAYLNSLGTNMAFPEPPAEEAAPAEEGGAAAEEAAPVEEESAPAEAE